MAKTKPFDELLDDYESWFETNRFVYLTELDAVEHYVPHGAKGVEIGVGSGRFAGPLRIQTGVEPSKAMRERARQRGITVLDGVAEHLPLSDNSFDFALMVTTICFVDDVEQSLREIYRILKPGGCCIIGFVDSSSSLGRQYQERKDENPFYRPATFYSAAEVTAALRVAGFGSIESIQTIFGELSHIHERQPFRPGHGEGGFVVIRAAKPEAGQAHHDAN